MENTIVWTIVGLAGAWAGLRFFRKRKPTDCSSGCGGCSCAQKPQPLVTLKR